MWLDCALSDHSPQTCPVWLDLPGVASHRYSSGGHRGTQASLPRQGNSPQGSTVSCAEDKFIFLVTEFELCVCIMMQWKHAILPQFILVLPTKLQLWLYIWFLYKAYLWISIAIFKLPKRCRIWSRHCHGMDTALGLLRLCLSMHDVAIQNRFTNCSVWGLLK